MERAAAVARTPPRGIRGAEPIYARISWNKSGAVRPAVNARYQLACSAQFTVYRDLARRGRESPLECEKERETSVYVGTGVSARAT